MPDSESRVELADVSDKPVDEPSYEDVNELTKNGSPPSFNREKVLKIVCLSVGAIIVSAFVLNSVNKSGAGNKTNITDAASIQVPEFLKRERDNASRPDNVSPEEDGLPVVGVYPSGLPEVQTASSPYSSAYPAGGAGQPVSQADGVPDPVYPDARPYPPPPAQARSGGGSGGGGGGGNSGIPKPEHSPLIPQIEGSLFGSGQAPPTYQAPYNPYDNYLRSLDIQRASAQNPAYTGYAGQEPSYQAQNMQDDKKNFYSGPENAITGRNGYFLGDNVIWTGGVIPGVLVTGINTDLPGDVVARVTGNVYDSRTGKNLLLPQGTILVARYNSSVSYAQSRVQIVWDHLIRPDGYMFNLEGMNGVDAKGISGQAGAYHENWFQYVKAAGIIAMFTLANAKLTEVAGVKLSEDTAQANAQLTAQLGNNIISRALDIQPTITVDSGTKINIMLNKPVYLPPVDDYPVTERYVRR